MSLLLAVDVTGVGSLWDRRPHLDPSGVWIGRSSNCLCPSIAPYELRDLFGLDLPARTPVLLRLHQAEFVQIDIGPQRRARPRRYYHEELERVRTERAATRRLREAPQRQ